MSGTKDKPWKLKTPSGQSEYVAYRDDLADPASLVVQVGKTELRYHLSAIDDLQAMLKQHGDWMALGSADEQKPAAEGTVEAWARSPQNPVNGWYGLGPRRGRAQRPQQPHARALAGHVRARASCPPCSERTNPDSAPRTRGRPSSPCSAPASGPSASARRTPEPSAG